MTRTSQQVFQEFVNTFESRRACADALGRSYPLVCALVNGGRAVSKDIAEAANKLRPQFTREALLFGDPQAKAA